MAIIGLLLLAAAVTFGVELGVSSLNTTGFEVFGTAFTTDVATVFVLGALTMAVATLGAFMITGAFQRRRAYRTEARHRVRQEETDTKLTDYDRTTGELVEENDRLRAELAAERRAAATMGGVAVPPGAGDVAYGDQVTDAVRSDTVSERVTPYPSEPVSPVAEVTPDTDTRAGAEKADVVGRFRKD